MLSEPSVSWPPSPELVNGLMALADRPSETVCVEADSFTLVTASLSPRSTLSSRIASTLTSMLSGPVVTSSEPSESVAVAVTEISAPSSVNTS